MREAHPHWIQCEHNIAGRVSEAHPPSNMYSGDIYQSGEMVPFAITPPLYVRLPHANVQRGLTAAPFAIPAPGRKSPFRGSRAFFPPATGRARQYVPVLSCPRTGSLRCAPACGETARPIFFSRSKTITFIVGEFHTAGAHSLTRPTVNVKSDTP